MCNEGAHKFWTLCVSVPSLVIWGAGVPLVMLFIMFKKKNILYTTEMKTKFGFLYNGYKHRFFYWEIIIMFRKIFLILIQMVILQFGSITQALIVLLMMIFFLYANAKQSPFTYRALNILETSSLLASLLTIYCGTYFISSGNASNDSSTE